MSWLSKLFGGGKSSSTNYPDYYEDPNISKNVDLLSSVGRGLLSGNFLNPSDSTLGFLNPLVSLNPQMTQQATGLATRGIIDTRNIAQNDIIQQLEANNQLTSSVTGNRLADLNKSFSQDIADVYTKFNLADEERAMSNIYNLFGLGTSVVPSATNLAQSRSSDINNWNLSKYASDILSNQLNQKGGLSGALSGAFQGGLAGFTTTGSPWGAFAGATAGGLSGYYGQQGGNSSLGSGLLSSALAFKGRGIGNTDSSKLNPFQLTDSRASQIMQPYNYGLSGSNFDNLYYSRGLFN